MIELPQLGAALGQELGLHEGPGHGRAEVHETMAPLAALVFLVGVLMRSVPMRFPPATLVGKDIPWLEGPYLDLDR